MDNTEEQYKGGPRSEVGKNASSKNSFKHGMCSSQILIPGENAEEFESLVDHLELDHKPANVTELILVHNLAKFQWLMNRAIRLQEKAFLDPEKIDTNFLELMLRYQNTNHRAFTNTLKTLHSAQKERVKQEKEFVSQLPVVIDFSRGPDTPDDVQSTFIHYPEGKTAADYLDDVEETPRTFERPPGKLA